jgi:hypothetical protein
MAKRQLTFEVSDKPQFGNQVEIRQALVFLNKLESTVKLYNKYSKALKDHMVKQGLTDIVVDDYHAHISEGTARCTLNSQLIEEFVKGYGKTIDDFKTIGTVPKSLEIYRD